MARNSENSIRRLWESPTLTSWAYQGATSLQLFLVAPFLLSNFNETEISAWYLFASLNLIGSILSQRVLITFARLITIVISNPDSLSTERGSEKRDAVEPKTELGSVIATLSAFQLSVGIIATVISIVLCILGLAPLLAYYTDRAEIWTVYCIYQVGSMLAIYVSRYHAILLGLNAVAVSNRCNFFSLIVGLIALAATIETGLGIIPAMLVSQSIAIAGGLFARSGIAKVSPGRTWDLERIGFDIGITRNVLAPITKSLVNQVGTVGMLPVASILVSRTGDVVATASFAFAIRILMAIDQFSMAPFNSIQPTITSLMAKGERSLAHRLLKGKAMISLLLFGIGILIAGMLLGPALLMIKARTHALDVTTWYLLSASVFIGRVYLMMLTPFYAMNNIVMCKEAILHTILSISAIGLLMPIYDSMIIGPCIILSYFIVYNTKPYRKYSSLMSA